MDQLGGNSVSTLIREDVRIAEATFGHSSVTFDINSVSDGLYKVLIKAHNPLKSAGEASEWSDAIGAGEPQRLKCITYYRGNRLGFSGLGTAAAGWE